MPPPQPSPALPSSAQPNFPTTRTATFLRGYCLSQNSNSFNTLMHCWKTPVMLPWNRTLHPIRAHNHPLCPPGMVFPNILSPRPKPPKETWSSPWLGPFWLEKAWMEAEQMLMAMMQTTWGSHNRRAHTSGITCSLLEEQAELFFIGHEPLFPHTSPPHPTSTASPAARLHIFLPSLLGKRGGPILSTYPPWGESCQ